MCYKATTTKTVITKRGERKKPIIAWFCPDLPINFGVKDFHGLPGATILLDEKTVVYTLSEINLNFQEVIDVEEPTRGIRVTQKEFNTYLKKKHKRF